MENIIKVTIALACFMVLSVQIGEALQCHVCNSGKQYDGATCDDPIGPTQHVETCDTKKGNYSMCRKVRQDVDGDVRIIRSCALTGQNRCIDRTGTKNLKITYCQCEGETCNTAAATYQSTLTLLISSAVVMFAALRL